jgi:hypothetical protein
MTALRVVIAGLYSNAGTVFISQLLHASSTLCCGHFQPAAGYWGWWLQYLGVGWGRDLVRRGSGPELPDALGIAGEQGVDDPRPAPC